MEKAKLNTSNSFSSTKICIITWPLKKSQAAQFFLFDLLKIVGSFFKEIYVITDIESSIENNEPDKFVFINIHSIFDKNEKIISKIFDEIIFQIKVSKTLFNLDRDIKIIWIYGGGTLTLPIIFSRILNKKLYINVLGSESRRIKFAYQGTIGRFLSYCINIIEHFNYQFAWRIIVESESVIQSLNIERLRKKVIPLGARFIDINNFRPLIQYQNRENLVGYIGRISGEKGIINFVEAIKLMKEDKSNEKLKFLIVGEGPLLSDIINQLKQLNSYGCLEFTSWIPHNKLPQVLNRLKLLVLPSHTEGLSTIVLESMACCTPILVTAVGGIPDVIQDNKTGFLLNDTSPQSIVDGVKRVLNNSNIDEITSNARKVIEDNYKFDDAKTRYKKIISGE
jgi:glycosyltransferase involved in cell wall biosynthesis